MNAESVDDCLQKKKVKNATPDSLAISLPSTALFAVVFVRGYQANLKCLIIKIETLQTPLCAVPVQDINVDPIDAH
jgi:hypothetical protein